jgi:hypothetical protein
MHRIKGPVAEGSAYMMYLAPTSGAARLVMLAYDVYGGTPEVSETNGYDGGPGPFFRTTAPMENDASQDGWLFRSRNKNVFCAGFKQGDEPPKNMFDSTYGYGVMRADAKPVYSTIPSFGTYNSIVGINSSYNNKGVWKQGTVVVSKKALGVPPEWLV